MSVYSPLQILFVHIPKTGGTSISEWMQSNLPGSIHYRMTHPNIEWLREQHPLADLAFTAVRNPWARAASFYTYHKQRLESGISTIDGYDGVPTFEEFILQYLDISIDHTKYAVKGKYTDSAYWFRMSTPQTDWIDSDTIVLRTETLSDDFKRIQEEVGCFKPLPIKRVSSKADYRTLYNTTTKAAVAKFYQKDIDTFKYAF